MAPRSRLCRADQHRPADQDDYARHGHFPSPFWCYQSVNGPGGQRLADDAEALAALALTRDAKRGDEDPFAVLHGLYWLAADIAQQAPLLLAVDDLHWADQPSLRFVAHLAHRLEGLAVLLVLTVREPRSAPAQQKSLIAGLAAEASVIALRPAALGAAACAELVRGTLGADPSPAFQDACRELTGGNPLLLRGLLTSLAAEGVKGTDAEVAQQRGWPLASVLAATVASLVALYDGDVGQALAYGQQATACGGWISVMATAFMIPALIDRGPLDEARALLAAAGLTGRLGPTWPYNVARHARGRLHAAAGEHASAVRELLEAGERAELWGVRNTTLMPWRSDAALSLLALGDGHEASRLCAEEVELARQWGAARGLGIALRAAGVAEGGGRGLELLTEAVSVLRPSPRCHAGTRRADAERTASGAAGGGRADEPADRTGPFRHPANRGESPDQHLRQTRDQLPA